MANIQIHSPKTYSEKVRKTETTDPVHANIVNPIIERLINNDAFLKNLAEKIVSASEGHKHSGIDGDGPKLPLSSLDESVARKTDLAAHENKEDNPHQVTWTQVGAPSENKFNMHVAETATQTHNGHMSKEDKAKLDRVESGANKYEHPSKHTASVITQDSTHRFVSDTEKSTWNTKIANYAAEFLNEIQTVTLSSTKRFPFTNSVQTISLAMARKTLNYDVSWEVTSTNGNVGDISVTDKQLNGFKVAFDGSATSVTLKIRIKGGMLV